MNGLQSISEDIGIKEKRAATDAFFENKPLLSELLKSGTEIKTLGFYIIAEYEEPNPGLARSYNSVMKPCTRYQVGTMNYMPFEVVITDEFTDYEEKTSALPDEIESFLCQNNLVLCFDEIKKLILSTFKNISCLGIRFETDPEIEGNKWVCFDITINDMKELVFDYYDLFTEKFTEKFPEEKRRYFRLAIDLE